MKRFIGMVMLGIMLVMTPVSAAENEMGHIGGISEGSNLPKTIEKYVDIPSSTSNTYRYKEVVFITGEPVIFEGTIEVDIDDSVIEDQASGSYTETYEISATNVALAGTLERTLEFITYYTVKEGEFKKQVVTNSVLDNWEEIITVDGASYTLVEGSATFSKAGVKDRTPGINYFDTDVSYVATFMDADSQELTLTVQGTNYGYDQAWSKIETQERQISIDYDSETEEDINATTKSILESKKTIYYDKTEPYTISFAGTYNQRMERESILTYQVNTYHKDYSESDYKGSTSIVSANQIEKLPIPENLDFMQGHWAESDFKKLYSMEVFTEIPHTGMQYEAISRGDFIKALCLAMNIDVSDYMEERDLVIFGDVTQAHPHYPYVMAAYDKKLIKGTGENFDVDRPINREEAFVIYIRVIGLERLGVTDAPTTSFIDDAQISDWAKKEIVAGQKLGIIKGDDDHNVNPKQWISKAEAAAIVNRLIDYLREDIAKDYRK